MARIPREAFSGFGHEAGSDAEFATQRFDDVSERLLAVREMLVAFWGITNLKSPALSAICLISPNSRAWHNHKFGLYIYSKLFILLQRLQDHFPCASLQFRTGISHRRRRCHSSILGCGLASSGCSQTCLL